jgi:uncharacterized phage protein (TIGR01671 family)
MREIKFRAWFPKEQVMLYFDNPDFCGGYNNLTFAWVENGKEVSPSWTDSGKSFPFDWDSPRELMQYTGLKDKQGKEIYEGDIVLWEDWHGFEDEMAHPEPDYDWRKPHEIIWDDCGFNIKMPFDNNLRISGKYDYIKQYGVEIIGNIYQNPELLAGLYPDTRDG